MRSDKKTTNVEPGEVNKRSGTAGRHVISGTMSILLSQTFILPVGLITSIFLARRLGPTSYGLFVLASSLVTWVEWTGTTVFSDATVKFVSSEADWRPVGTTVVRLHLMVSGSIAVLLWVLSSPLSRVFNEPAVANYLKLFSIDIPIFALACANGKILVGKGRFKVQARLNAMRWTVRLGLIVLFVEMGLSVEGAIIGSIGASVFELVMSRFYVRPSVFSRSSFPIRRLWSVALPLFMSSLSLRIFKLDLIALKVLGGTATHVGFYGAAQNFTMPANMFSKSLSPPLLSTLSQLLREGDEPKAKKIGRAAMRSCFWLLPFAAMTAGASSEIVRFVFGDRFLSAGPILASLIFAAVGLLTVSISKSILTAAGRPAWTFVLTGPAVPLAIIGHLIMIPWLGGVGASIVTSFIACLMALASVWAVHRTWGVVLPVKTLVNSALCSGLALALAMLWPAFGIMVILKLVTIVLITFSAFLLLGEFTASELALVRSLLRQRLSFRQSEVEPPGA